MILYSPIHWDVNSILVTQQLHGAQWFSKVAITDQNFPR